MKDSCRTIMLVDDHAIVREGYRSVLQKQPGLQVIAEAAEGAEAYRLFKETQLDSNARILVFTMHQNAAFAVQGIRAGACGFVTKTSPPEALVGAIYDVFTGRIALSPDIDHELALSRLGHERIATEDLTAREFKVLRRLLAEKTAVEIADTLNISPRTVANHHSLIKSKLGVSSDIELVRLALRQRILE